MVEQIIMVDMLVFSRHKLLQLDWALANSVSISLFTSKRPVEYAESSNNNR